MNIETLMNADIIFFRERVMVMKCDYLYKIFKYEKKEEEYIAFINNSKEFLNEWLYYYNNDILFDEPNNYILNIQSLNDLNITDISLYLDYTYNLLIFIIALEMNIYLVRQAREPDLLLYRGQEDSTWLMLPSIYRKISENHIFDSKYIYLKYKNLGLLKKYHEHIDSSIDELDYNVLSFMQHSCSFSPFLDFTENKNIAKVFAATRRSNFNEYTKTKCKVFTISIFEGEKDNKFLKSVSKIECLKDEATINEFLKNNYKMYVISNSSISFGKPVSFKVLKNGKIEDEELCISSFKQLVELLTPKIAIIDLKTNDRIKYQKGVFLLFYDCLSISGRIFYNLSSNLHLEDEEYTYSDKIKMLDDIRTNDHENTYDYLIDPYKIFNE